MIWQFLINGLIASIFYLLLVKQYNANCYEQKTFE